MSVLIEFLENNMLSCFWKSAGLECTGCGLQRAMVHLLKGEFTEAFLMYPAIYTLIGMALFLLLHLKFQFSFGARLLKVLFILNVLIIITNYILKFI